MGVNGHWTAAKNNLVRMHFFIDAAIGRANAAYRF
jgi:hypothetical protein